MELTSEQYNQICRYASGEMEEKEKAFFESVLYNDEALRSGVEAYREMQSIFASVGQKLHRDINTEDEKKNVPQTVRNLIAAARAEWEAEQEVRVETTSNEEEKQSEKIAVVKNRVPGVRKLSGWNGWPLMAAAIVAGVICLTAFLYLQNKSAPAATEPQANNPLPSPALISENDKSKVIAHLPASDSPAQNRQGLEHNKPVKTLTTAQLFATHFKPDAIPAKAANILREPLSFYETKSYADAIETFEMAKAALDTRGSTDEASNTRFYTHYFLGLSHLAAGTGNTAALAELKAAEKVASNNNQRSKAQWYLALSYLKRNDTAATIKSLNGLIRNTVNVELKNRALTLLQQLMDE